LRVAEAGELRARPQSAWFAAGMVVVGLALLVGGSKLFLTGAVGIARAFDVSDAVIGLTLVAVGTSLPELSISMIAALRGHADVAIGNVLGSNLFNLLGILGVSAVLTPLAIPRRIILVDQWVMLGSVVALTLFLVSGRRLSRPEAAVLLVAYAIYVGASFALVTA
jgi:cation:H+ antiporter